MEIKFRAWDKKNKIMTYSEVNQINFNGQILLNDGKFHDIKNTDYVLMQSTGLKDRNGKEIFKNDILKQVKKNGECFAKKYLVSWDKDNAKFTNLEYIDKKIVIGNIFENPELLNK
jgi:uncharacterized phage protein (TIGR01671 family)